MATKSKAASDLAYLCRALKAPSLATGLRDWPSEPGRELDP